MVTGIPAGKVDARQIQIKHMVLLKVDVIEESRLSWL